MMEENKKQNLNLEELDQVTGGQNLVEEVRRYSTVTPRKIEQFEREPMNPVSHTDRP